MDEIIDIYDEQTGKKTGKTISKKEAHKNGTWHSSIHIIIIDTKKEKTLLQKRCADKDLYPNTWDIAVGGHISTGEDELISAKRELSEELGLNPDNYDIKYLETVKESLTCNEYISNEFVSIYLIESDIYINDITLQKEEVSDIKWVTKEELNNYILLPHSKDYEILNSILK